MALDYSHKEETAFIVGSYKKPVTLYYTPGGRIYVKFPYNKQLLAEIKSFEGAKWHGYDDKPIKMWSIAGTERNMFQLLFLEGRNPYEPYDMPPAKVESTRNLYKHQLELIGFGLTRPSLIMACEMGTGKTLAAIEIAERRLKSDDVLWYIGPKSGIMAVRREFKKWDASVQPERYITYESLVKVVESISAVPAIPRMVIFDESSKIKNPTAQRSNAARALADLVRKEYRERGIIILMSGTPAPRVPTDWWHQCEVACPGFIKEGTIHKFKAGLCVIEERKSIDGGSYPVIVSWKDDPCKCDTCGRLRDEGKHDQMIDPGAHPFKPSINEVARLYKRLTGLVIVKFKKDCIDLPEKTYELIRLKPTVDTIRVAQMIVKQSKSTLQALILLRELSDGFQYTDEQNGTIKCPECSGDKMIEDYVSDAPVDTLSPNTGQQSAQKKLVPCPYCDATGEVPTYKREAVTVDSPKDSEFIDQLDLHDDIGRFIVWGGFTATIDKLVNIAHQYGWTTLRVDGRGYYGEDPVKNKVSAEELLDAMDASHNKSKELLEKYPKVCFVGHPKAGGMALTLTASPTELFYSNTFEGEARMQAEDRFHRPGADFNKGCKIIDLIHLPIDEKVLINLRAKKKLQNMSMGELAEALSAVEEVIRT